MKLKGFIKYLEAVREDEFSGLNDDLPDNKSKSSKDQDWEDFYQYNDDSTRGFRDYEDWYDDEDDDYYGRSSNPKFNGPDDYEDSLDEEDDIQHLTYLLRQMFRNSGINDVQITAVKNEDIVIEVLMPKKDSLRNIIKAFEVANKLKRDILAQYDSEFDIYTNTRGGGVLSFAFTLDEGLDDDNQPF